MGSYRLTLYQNLQQFTQIIEVHRYTYNNCNCLMGCTPSFDRKHFRVATLNFSGICISPFEYHDSTAQKQQLSDLFQQIMAQVIDDPKFTWNVGKIDTILQVERYTPIYRKDVCVKDGILVNKSQFDEAWNLEFNKASTQQKIKQKMPSNEQVDQCRKFDWMCYVTILNFLFRSGQKSQYNLQRIKQYKVDKFQKFLEKMHSKSYLNNLKKMNMTIDFIKKNDIAVLLLQQAKTSDKTQWIDVLPKNFSVVDRKGSESVVIYNNQFIHVDEIEKQQFYQKYSSLINFNTDTAFIKTKDFVLVSAHLSSKEKNVEQTLEMNRVFDQIIADYPGVNIICGVDSNRFIDGSKQFINKQTPYHVFPHKGTQYTTTKKRTYIQLQTKKANQIIIETKDHIITTLKINKSGKDNFTKIWTLEGQQANQKIYLPSQGHPFDHFLVSSEVYVEELGDVGQPS